MRAFDNGASVGENGDFVWGYGESQQKIILTDVGGYGGESLRSEREIEIAIALVNLD